MTPHYISLFIYFAASLPIETLIATARLRHSSLADPCCPSLVRLASILEWQPLVRRFVLVTNWMIPRRRVLVVPDKKGSVTRKNSTILIDK
jgi:hypothetical protein